MKKLSSSVFAYSLVSGMSVFAMEAQEFAVPKGDVALHNNQIFVKQNEEWISIGGIASDGRFYRSPSTSPLMSRCSRVEFEWDYENGKILFRSEFENTENRGNESENRQISEPNEPPDSRDHAERDHRD